MTLLGGRYTVGEMIGTGGMADVYIAQDERLARQVAVKVLRSDLAKDPSFVSRFRKEAFAAAGLNHPGIVAVYDSGEDPAPYIVMLLIYIPSIYFSNPTVNPGCFPTSRTPSSTPGIKPALLIESCRIESVSPSPPRSTSWCAISPRRRTE